jgi:RecJ-like exonuclease
MTEQADMRPGDEAPEGTPDTGETLCPDCSGSGQIDGGTCQTCSGSGKVIEGIGGG